MFHQSYCIVLNFKYLQGFYQPFLATLPVFLILVSISAPTLCKSSLDEQKVRFWPVGSNML